MLFSGDWVKRGAELSLELRYMLPLDGTLNAYILPLPSVNNIFSLTENIVNTVKNKCEHRCLVFSTLSTRFKHVAQVTGRTSLFYIPEVSNSVFKEEWHWKEHLLSKCYILSHLRYFNPQSDMVIHRFEKKAMFLEHKVGFRNLLVRK